MTLESPLTMIEHYVKIELLTYSELFVEIWVINNYAIKSEESQSYHRNNERNIRVDGLSKWIACTE